MCCESFLSAVICVTTQFFMQNILLDPLLDWPQKSSIDMLNRYSISLIAVTNISDLILPTLILILPKVSSAFNISATMLIQKHDCSLFVQVV